MVTIFFITNSFTFVVMAGLLLDFVVLFLVAAYLFSNFYVFSD